MTYKRDLEVKEFVKTVLCVNKPIGEMVAQVVPIGVDTLCQADIAKLLDHAKNQLAEIKMNKDYVLKRFVPTVDILKTQLHVPKISGGMVDEEEFIDYVYNKSQRNGRSISKESISNLLKRSNWTVLKSGTGKLYPIVLAKVEEILHSI